MHNNKILSAVLLLALLLTGHQCKNFLDELPQGNLTQEFFPSNEAEARLAVIACYNPLRSWFFHSGGYPILDIMSDDAYKGSNPTDQAGNLNAFDNFTFTATQDGLDRWWSTLYEGIKYTNVVIERVAPLAIETNRKNRYLAEAHFLRAVYYFDLARTWGGVPLVLDTNPGLSLERAGEEATYDNIIADLKFAIDHLPLQSALDPAEYGRATKGAAEAYLAKVYLYRKDFVNAETYALRVIQSNEYALDPSFANTFSILGQFNQESIFEVGALGFDGTGNGGNQYANTQGVRGTPNRGWGFNRPSLDLMDKFEQGDPRRDATIVFLGETIDGVKILGDGSTPDKTYSDPPANTLLQEIECYNQKVWIPGTSTAEQWGHNRRLMRYADVLLVAAEALNENGKSAEALVHLNAVRRRARNGDNTVLPDITETAQTTLRDRILNERRFELALEGQRFYDLVRTGKAASVLGPLGFKTDKHERLPIPQSEIDISQRAIQQNKGW